MKRTVILSLVFLIFFIQIISASSVNVKNYSITTQYSPSGIITGIINLNLSNISANAYIRSSLGQNISLRDLIKKQSNFNYSCTIADCNSSYTAVDSGSDTKQVNLVSGQSQVFGFPIDGKITSMSSDNKFSLDLASDVSSSFLPQLSIDLLNDNNPEWTSYKPAGVFGGRFYGCYTPDDYTGDLITIDTTGVCEKVFLPISPDINIGAYLTGSGGLTVQMSVQDLNGNSAAGTCTNVTSASSTEVSCIPKVNNINYSIKQSGDFFICIKKITGTGTYKIKTEHTSASSTKCGFYGTPPQTYGADYEIFASSDRFDSVGTFTLNDAETSKSWYQISNLEAQIASYLSSKYGNDCSNGCVVPISFKAGLDQGVSISNISLVIPTTIGARTYNKISDVVETPVFISTRGYQNLSLSPANFSAPDSFGNYTFTLTLFDGTNSYPLLSNTIMIKQIPKIVSVTPDIVAGATPTEFTVSLDSLGTNITQYKWDFGDGTPVQTTTSKTVVHTYNELKIYNMTVTIINSQGYSASAIFSINVVSPRDAVPQLLIKDMNSVSNIETQFASYPKFTQDAIKQILNLDDVKAQLQNLNASAATASTDSQFLNIMKDLVKINLPDSIQQTSSAAAAPFFPSGDKIDLDVLKAIGGGNYDSSKKSQYTDAIVLWDLNNIQLTLIDQSEFSSIKGSTITPILNTVKINFGGVNGNAYLVIPKLSNIYLDKNYSQIGDFYYVPLSNNPATIQFATSESLSPTNLPIFIAPSLNQISLPGEEATGNKMIIFFIVMGSVILVGIIAYVIVGKWYQKKYESYLFKDKNDLYNIINYVHSLKSRGIKGNDIEKNLQKAKWSSEQISYVMKRYAGKKVGIPGFLRKPKVQ